MRQSVIDRADRPNPPPAVVEAKQLRELLRRSDDCELCGGPSADGLLRDAHVHVYACTRVCVTQSTVRCGVCDKGLLGERLCIGVLNAENCCTTCLWLHSL